MNRHWLLGCLGKEFKESKDQATPSQSEGGSADVGGHCRWQRGLLCSPTREILPNIHCVSVFVQSRLLYAFM
jgi:hypothetical protein